jgi:hypothetical protein
MVRMATREASSFFIDFMRRVLWVRELLTIPTGLAFLSRVPEGDWAEEGEGRR